MQGSTQVQATFFVPTGGDADEALPLDFPTEDDFEYY